jgi:predicted O-methyltransferase YrrM
MAGVDRLVESAVTLPVGQISLTEGRFLGSLVSALPGPGPIVEIGTLFGWSTRIMTLFKEPGRELLTVDSFAWNPLGLSADDHFRATSRILADAVQGQNVRLIRQDKREFYATYAGLPPALVFLDAIHTYEETQADIAWARKVNAAVVCLHDYGPGFPGVVRAVDEAGGARTVVGSLAVLV